MKKIILTLLLATTSLSFADIYKDACEDFDKEQKKNNKLTILDYAEGLSARTNQARNANKHDEADRLLRLFAVTVSTGLKFGINKNPTPDLVARVEKALDEAYSPLSKKGLSSNDLTKSLDDAYESSRTKGTLDQYAAVVEHSYHAVGLHDIKPWADVPNINEIKTKKPSEIFIPSVFEKKVEKPKVVTPDQSKKIDAPLPRIKKLLLRTTVPLSYEEQEKDFDVINKHLEDIKIEDLFTDDLMDGFDLKDRGFMEILNKGKKLPPILEAAVKTLFEKINFKNAMNDDVKARIARQLLSIKGTSITEKNSSISWAKDPLGQKLSRLSLNINNPKVNLINSYLELAKILMEADILAVVKVNLLTDKPYLAVENGQFYDLKTHHPGDIYFELSGKRPQRMNTIGKLTVNYPSIELQDEKRIKELKSILNRK